MLCYLDNSTTGHTQACPFGVVVPEDKKTNITKT